MVTLEKGSDFVYQGPIRSNIYPNLLPFPSPFPIGFWTVFLTGAEEFMGHDRLKCGIHLISISCQLLKICIYYIQCLYSDHILRFQLYRNEFPKKPQSPSRHNVCIYRLKRNQIYNPYPHRRYNLFDPYCSLLFCSYYFFPGFVHLFLENVSTFLESQRQLRLSWSRYWKANRSWKLIGAGECKRLKLNALLVAVLQGYEQPLLWRM